jgi:NAD(P)-dependent dehydrogenase (short-subunit alcohol dehydrogenase family)
MRVVVTGASRGIGLEFTRQLAARGDRVVAAVRDPARASELASLAAGARAAVSVHRLDVTDDASVQAFAAEVGDEPVDLLINNAGVFGGSHQSLGDVDFDDAIATYEINALGPLRLTFALLPAIRRGAGKKIAHLTSGMGSIGDNRSGGDYAYRMSKAALNMAAVTLARDLAVEKIISFVINPGWVKTDMGGARAPTEVTDSVAGMLGMIDGATADSSGRFLNWRGNEYPW